MIDRQDAILIYLHGLEWTTWRTTRNSGAEFQVSAVLQTPHLCQPQSQIVAHKIYGVPQTINTANYVYFLAYKELFVLRNDTNPSERLDEIVNGIECMYVLQLWTDAKRHRGIPESPSRSRPRSVLER